jgi:hypothetical protein
VDRFAAALKGKLAAAEKKYGYSDGWAEPDWMQECRAKLVDHIAKGDPRDVAAYCAFLWHHGESTAAHQGAHLAVPEGWQIVPVEPTPWMLLAVRRDTPAAAGWREKWKALLAAAPSASSKQGGER